MNDTNFKVGAGGVRTHAWTSVRPHAHHLIHSATTSHVNNSCLYQAVANSLKATNTLSLYTTGGRWHPQHLSTKEESLSLITNNMTYFISLLHAYKKSSMPAREPQDLALITDEDRLAGVSVNHLVSFTSMLYFFHMCRCINICTPDHLSIQV